MINISIDNQFSNTTIRALSEPLSMCTALQAVYLYTTSIKTVEPALALAILHLPHLKFVSLVLFTELLHKTNQPIIQVSAKRALRTRLTPSASMGVC